MELARWTTPALSYKPASVAAADIDDIFIVIKQNGQEILRKSKAESTIDQGRFVWVLTQTETALFDSSNRVTIQIDYTSGSLRYTTRPRVYEIRESAINEVIE